MSRPPLTLDPKALEAAARAQWEYEIAELTRHGLVVPTTWDALPPADKQVRLRCTARGIEVYLRVWL